MPNWLLVVRQILGKIADVMIAGRSLGLWTKGKGPKF
jgi:hypothetical protein